MDPAAARVLAVVVSALAGLVIGSFLNVVVYRLPRGQSVVRPASRCPSCGTALSALDNIPVVSWVALRGKCRHCGAPISVRYPAIELLTGTLFTALAIGSPSPAPLAPLDAVAAATLAIGAIDLEGSAVPPVLGWVALGCAATLVPVALVAHTPGRLAWAGVGAAVAMAAWGLDALPGQSEVLRMVPSAPACAAWGWCAGWIALGGGIAVGATLGVLALIAHANATRRLPVGALGAATTVGVLIGGAIAAR
jgi:leader peptidase (prepilin peptidase) / N-methyltransferase